jgi:hypothetical protein
MGARSIGSARRILYFLDMDINLGNKMDDVRFMKTCSLCNMPYQYGPHRYDGKHIPRYDLDVCTGCYKANEDGWSPAHEKKILKHLEEKGLPRPERNEKGWLPRD